MIIKRHFCPGASGARPREHTLETGAIPPVCDHGGFSCAVRRPHPLQCPSRTLSPSHCPCTVTPSGYYVTYAGDFPGVAVCSRIRACAAVHLGGSGGTGLTTEFLPKRM
jgi:hypothetical protein